MGAVIAFYSRRGADRFHSICDMFRSRILMSTDRCWKLSICVLCRQLLKASTTRRPPTPSCRRLCVAESDLNPRSLLRGPCPWGTWARAGTSVNRPRPRSATAGTAVSTMVRFLPRLDSRHATCTARRGMKSASAKRCCYGFDTGGALARSVHCLAHSCWHMHSVPALSGSAVLP